jgi:hypothetical protein
MCCTTSTPAPLHPSSRGPCLCHDVALALPQHHCRLLHFHCQLVPGPAHLSPSCSRRRHQPAATFIAMVHVSSAVKYKGGVHVLYNRRRCTASSWASAASRASAATAARNGPASTPHPRTAFSHCRRSTSWHCGPAAPPTALLGLLILCVGD